MPAPINVSEDDLAYAERILLGPGELFDKERRDFIRHPGTIDLQAVPGSGKTTALLAKLLILDRHLPFPDGAGILVLSHTNAAMDEIRERIGHHCSNLFRYPNFIGTIQAFVDEFLTVPFYANRFGKLPLRIDDDTYGQRFSSPPFNMQGYSAQESKNARRYLMGNKKAIRWTFDGTTTCLTDGYGGKPIDFKKPQAGSKNYADWNEAEKKRIGQWVGTFKKQLLAYGYLCFDDAYLLAQVGLHRNPSIKRLIQKRFAHVFVDEMQDMEKHQHDLLEELFFDGGTSVSAYQRIGDKNQAIFADPAADVRSYWKNRGTVLELNGSYRLTPAVASIVERFAVEPIRVEGRRKNADGTDVAIRPQIIVFPEGKQELVIPKFAEAIAAMLADGRISASPGNKYAAVGWTTAKEDGKLRLCDYCPGYSKEQRQRKADYSTLHSCIANYDKEDRTFGSVEKSLAGAFLRLLREEGIADGAGAQYSKKGMANFLREANPDYWARHEMLMYQWCRDVLRGKGDEVLAAIRHHVPDFLSQFGKVAKHSADFTDGAAGPTAPLSVLGGGNSVNALRFEGFHVGVSTVHAVKGETHTATLYMETFYQKGGGGSHESERLKAQFGGAQVQAGVHKYARQSAQMVYVGFSRPTHLLCFAVHESRFGELAALVDPGVWDIVKL